MPLEKSKFVKTRKNQNHSNFPDRDLVYLLLVDFDDLFKSKYVKGWESRI